jgi:hypothetical protein
MNDGSDVNPEVARDDYYDNDHANDIENTHCFQSLYQDAANTLRASHMSKVDVSNIVN